MHRTHDPNFNPTVFCPLTLPGSFGAQHVFFFVTHAFLNEISSLRFLNETSILRPRFLNETSIPRPRVFSVNAIVVWLRVVIAVLVGLLPPMLV